MSKWQLYGFPDIRLTNIGKAIEGLYLAYNERVQTMFGSWDALTFHPLEPTATAIDRLKTDLSWRRWTRWYTNGFYSERYGGVTYYPPEFMTKADPLASLSWINSGEAGWKADCIARYGLDWDADWTFLPTVEVVTKLYHYINDIRWRGNYQRYIYQRQWGPDHPGEEDIINVQGETVDRDSYSTSMVRIASNGYYNWPMYQGQGITPNIPRDETSWKGRFAGMVARCNHNTFPFIEDYSAENYYSWYAADGIVNPVEDYVPPFPDLPVAYYGLVFYAPLPITDCSGLYEFYDA